MTNALGFFASVIKSGEKWSVECDKMLRAAFDTTPHPDAAAREELLEAACAVLHHYVIGGVVACHGLKCRELNCESCYGEEYADAFVAGALAAANRLREAIDAARRADAGRGER